MSIEYEYETEIESIEELKEGDRMRYKGKRKRGKLVKGTMATVTGKDYLLMAIYVKYDNMRGERIVSEPALEDFVKVTD